MKKITLTFLTICLLACVSLFCDFNMNSSVYAVANSNINISTSEQLQNISNNLLGNYTLESNISLTTWTSIENFKGSLDGNGKTISVSTNQPFMLFKNSENATIKNLKLIVNHNYQIVQDNENKIGLTISGENYGLIVGEALNTTIECCDLTYITNPSKSPTEPNTKCQYYFALTDNACIGSIVGWLKNGSQISNCVVNSSSSDKLVVEQRDTDSLFTYVGAICGRVTSSKISYIISNLGVVLTNSEHTQSSSMYAGGIVGYVEGASAKVINCVSMSDVSGDGINGIFVGLVSSIESQVPSLNNNGKISMLVSTYSSSLSPFGSSIFYSMETSEYKTNQSRELYSSETPYKLNNFWIRTEDGSWNFDSIWTQKNNYIELQVFNSFIFEVDNDNEYLTLAVNEKNSDTVEYGNDAVITATFNNIEDTQKNYSIFFNIKKLYLNNISNEVSIDYTVETTSSQTVYKWIVNNVNASSEGTYGVELSDKTYKIKVRAQKTDNIVRGKVKRLNATTQDFEYEDEISFGVQRKYESVAEMFFSVDGWKVGDDKLEYNTNVTKSTFNVVYNESFVQQYLATTSMSNILEKVVNTSNEDVSPLLVVDASFANDACTLKFDYKLDGIIVEDNFGAIIKIDGNVVTNNEYKITLNTTISITIDFANDISEEYIYNGMADATSTLVEIDKNNYTYNKEKTTATTTGEGSENTMAELTLSFSKVVKEEKNYLVWWLVGGGVVLLAGIIILFVVIMKNRDYSYKNMY